MVGVASAIATDVAWRLYPDNAKFKLKLTEEKSPLAFLEHYHYGLVSLSIGRCWKQYSSFFDGFGGIMMMLEAFQTQPFGIGKTSWEKKGNVQTTSFLIGVLLASISVCGL